MSTDLVINKFEFFEVVIPARDGAISSPTINKPLHKLPVGARPAWSVQFDELPKLIVKVTLRNGVTGAGEFYRDHDWRRVEQMATTLIGLNLAKTPLQRLPIASTREYDGFECALIDAYSRAQGLRVVDFLGGAVRDRVKVSAWSSHRTIEDIQEFAIDAVSRGFDTLKLKSDLEDPIVEICEEIRKHAPSLRLIIDPNERWKSSGEVRRRLRGLERVGNVLLLEDPIPHWMWDEWSELRRFSAIPIFMHISLPYAQEGQAIHDAISALKRNSVDGFNFNGSFDAFRRLDAVAGAAGLPCWHGSEIDLGILEAAYVHAAAAAPSCTYPSDVFGRSIRTEDLLKVPLRHEPPYIYLPDGPGLGITVDWERITQISRVRRTVTHEGF